MTMTAAKPAAKTKPLKTRPAAAATNGKRPHPRPRSIPKQLEAMDDVHVRCRGKRHHWSPIENDGEHLKKFADKPGVRIMLFECLQCESYLYEAWVIRTGDKLSSSIVYPQGYLLDKGTRAASGRLRVNDLRKVWLSRWG